MKPIHKFNNGNGATLCHRCRKIIAIGFTEDLYCSEKCKTKMRQQIFIDGSYDYDYEKQDQVHTLYYSNGDQWNGHIKGEVAMTIDDDGNGLKVKFNEKNRIDYSEAEKLFILLKLINQPAVYEISTKTPL